MYKIQKIWLCLLGVCFAGMIIAGPTFSGALGPGVIIGPGPGGIGPGPGNTTFPPCEPFPQCFQPPIGDIVIIGPSAPPTSVPEPATIILLGSGLAGLAAWRLTRKK